MRIVYSREFLLSVGDTEHCKKLPPGFDASLLRSFCPVVYQLDFNFFFVRRLHVLIVISVRGTVNCRRCLQVCLRGARATTVHP